MQSLINKIKDKSAQIAVIGLGYVGVPLALEFARAGYETIGIDIDEARVEDLNNKRSYLTDISNNEIAALVESRKFRATSDYSVLKAVDAISISVPTPLCKGKTPDLQYIISAVKELSKYLRRGQLVVLESTTYPGTTEELVLPLLAQTGLEVGKDFFLAFSPERIDPANTEFNIKNTPKIIGGITTSCLEVAESLYKAIIDKIVTVSSTKAAEMVKMLENTFRAINIGLANEMAIMCKHLDVDVWEIIEAASSKPYGFMSFHPGPGIGGHCIPVDPHFLSWKLKELNYQPRLIEVADEVNSEMPKYVCNIIKNALQERSKDIAGARVLLLGVAYKANVGDYRESPAIDLMRLLNEQNAEVMYHDPFVNNFVVGDKTYKSVPIADLAQYDCAVLLTAHSGFDMELIVNKSKLLIDTRNATRPFKGKHVIYI